MSYEKKETSRGFHALARLPYDVPQWLSLEVRTRDLFKSIAHPVRVLTLERRFVSSWQIKISEDCQDVYVYPVSFNLAYNFGSV